MRLSNEEIAYQLSLVEGWKLTDEKWIEKKYRFKEYLKGIQFVNQVAEDAEQMDHHPFISIDYKMVTLKLSSWAAKGLTELDFQSAQKYDELYKGLDES